MERPDDSVLVAALRAGDEAAFARVVSDWSRSMLLLARNFVATDAVAEEVVQDTWLAVIRGISGFEGRAALRTWVYRILVNTAKRRGERESRTIPWTSVVGEDGPSLDPALFQRAGEPNPGGWRAAPAPWPDDLGVEGSVLSGEVRDKVRELVELLPVRQRIVITMRDLLGCSSGEVAELMDVSAINQRVLLHRARTAVRAGLASYLERS